MARAPGPPSPSLIRAATAVIRQSGEIPFEAFDNYLSGMIAYYDGLDADIIDRRPLELALEGAGDPGTPLLYPGKVLADEAGDRLFIADSSHNRIVIADLSDARGAGHHRLVRARQ